MIGRVHGQHVTITGLGVHVPERILGNEEIARMVDTTDEWIIERTGIRERRVARPDEAMTDIALPAARRALEQAGLEPTDIDLLVVATVTPDSLFPTTSSLLADLLGATNAAAYDLLAGCTGFVYALAQAHGLVATGISKRALVVGGDVLSKIVDYTDRGTCVLFGDGAGAVVLEPCDEGGFLGFELGADGAGGIHLYQPAGGSRRPATADTVAAREHFIHMNGREVFRFATRVMVSSAESLLAECGKTIADVDVYVPHQANVRIIEHAGRKLGVPVDKTVVNVDRYGNTSSGSIPLALADGSDDGRIAPGQLVLMTGMGAGLTWGSALLHWTHSTNGATA